MTPLTVVVCETARTRTANTTRPILTPAGETADSTARWMAAPMSPMWLPTVAAEIRPPASGGHLRGARLGVAGMPTTSVRAASETRPSSPPAAGSVRPTPGLQPIGLGAPADTRTRGRRGEQSQEPFAGTRHQPTIHFADGVQQDADDGENRYSAEHAEEHHRLREIREDNARQQSDQRATRSRATTGEPSHRGARWSGACPLLSDASPAGRSQHHPVGSHRPAASGPRNRRRRRRRDAAGGPVTPRASARPTGRATPPAVRAPR
jgi:hypothetical protein